ncbi:MFS transporter [Lentilitoribacter sp. Alg239-R112]|uniref:MFS transporter n=1 Tax=Lentilitoribacter sp. Alg239-R112 TaxID=2305987 RepID=UPI001AEEA786|nr:MFS transporter [Lentilitoribacter sp. Alg239-R112]
MLNGRFATKINIAVRSISRQFLGMYPQALKNIELRKLFIAQLPADFSDWLDFVAIGALLAFVWDAPSFAYAALAVGLGAPYLVIGPFAGVFVDRWSIKSVLIYSNLGRAIVTGTFFFAGDWTTLIVLVTVRSSVDCFFTPAKQAAIQALTTKENRTSANGLSHGINQASKIVAPSAGGAFLIWFAPDVIFILNSIISASAAAFALRLNKIERKSFQDENSSDSVLTGVKNGMAIVRQSPVIKTALFMMAISYFAIFIYDTFIAPLTRNLNFEQQHLGYALAAVGIGGVCGSMLFSLLPNVKRPQYWVAAGATLSAIILLILGTFDSSNADMSTVLLISLFLTLGFATAMSVVPVRIVLQNTVPEERMGSVTALSEAANTTALLSAPFLGAVLVDTFSVGVPFIVGGIVIFIVAIIALRLKLD